MSPLPEVGRRGEQVSIIISEQKLFFIPQCYTTYTHDNEEDCPDYI